MNLLQRIISILKGSMIEEKDINSLKNKSEKNQNLPKSCHFCNKSLNVINTYHCKYCGEWHCDQHRLPEEHKCPGNLKNPHKGSSVITYKK